MKICIVVSSGGSVVQEVLRVPGIKKQVHAIVTDRVGNGQLIARENGIALFEIFSKDNTLFSDALSAYCSKEKIDFIFSFHTRLYAGELLTVFKNRIINFHLSILPAFPGFNAFGKAIAHGVKLLGTTVHFIDHTTDMGIPILQTVLPNDPALTISERRHLLFIQQCRSFIQLVDWLSDGRVHVQDGNCVVDGAHYRDTVFFPGLDSSAALNFPA